VLGGDPVQYRHRGERRLHDDIDQIRMLDGRCLLGLR
jgi:hypothetical protein